VADEEKASIRSTREDGRTLTESCALPTFAQQKDTVDLRTVQQRDLVGDAKALAEFGALGMKADEAFKNNDSADVAALFTDDAVLAAPDWMSSGLNVIDNAVWSAGQWFSTLQSETGPVFSWGYWSAIYVWEGDAWKIRMLTLANAQKRPRLLRRQTQSKCGYGHSGGFGFTNFNRKRIELFASRSVKSCPSKSSWNLSSIF
jgi:hypothetical protein